MPELVAESGRALEREVRDYLPGLAMERRDDTVRVAQAWPSDVGSVDALHCESIDGYALAGWNRLYYETQLVECEREIEGDGSETESEYAIELPPPTDLFDRFAQARDAAPLDLPREGIDARVGPGVFERFHERIETCKLRANRFENERYDDLAPEWDPTSEYTTNDQTPDVMEATTSGQKDAHLADFRDVVGVGYYTLFHARHVLVTGRFDRQESYSTLARETLGVTNEYQCADCDALLPPVELLQFNTYWLCDECADDRNAEKAVAVARERRYEEFAEDLAREDYHDFGEAFHYGVRVSDHRPTEYSHNDEKQFFATVEQGGDKVSMFAASRDRLCERVTGLLDRWSDREIISGRLVGPVALDVDTVHVSDEWTNGDFAATDFVPQSSLADFDGAEQETAERA